MIIVDLQELSLQDTAETPHLEQEIDFQTAEVQHQEVELDFLKTDKVQNQEGLDFLETAVLQHPEVKLDFQLSMMELEVVGGTGIVQLQWQEQQSGVHTLGLVRGQVVESHWSVMVMCRESYWGVVVCPGVMVGWLWEG
jgi:hypothetical protein